MTETTLTDKPWRYDGFGCIRCGRHVVLCLPPNLADEVSPEELVAIGKLAAQAPKLLSALKALFALHEPEGRFQPHHFKPVLRQVQETLAGIDVKEKA